MMINELIRSLKTYEFKCQQDSEDMNPINKEAWLLRQTRFTQVKTNML